MKKNKEIAIGISTFLRDESLFRLIKSLLEFCPEFRLYIVDQGVSTTFKKIIYKGLEKEGHIIKYIPFDSGISKSRYILKDICKEPYLVFMEDDFEATKNTNLYKLKEILEENPHLGVVGGNLQGYAKTGAYSFFLDYADDKICYFPLDYLVEKNLANWKETTQGTKFLEASIVSDFTMWRREVPNIFDENVKTIEHTHVYLLVKYKTKYKVAFCPESEIKHCHDKTSENYNNFRTRKTDVEYLKKYWNITDFYKFEKNKLHRLEQNIVHSPTEEIKIAQIISDNNDKFSEKEIIINNHELNKKYNPEEVFRKLNENNIHYILIKENCLNAICNKEINDIKICICNKKHLEEINNLFPNNNFYIEINHIKSTKIHSYKNIKVNVPMPVVKYLENIFNKSWEELKNGI